MTRLTIDPQPAPEPPYNPRKSCLYTDAAPFAAAIDEWVERRRRIEGHIVRDGRDERRYGYGPARHNPTPHLQVLAERAGIPARSLWAWRTRERPLISIELADKLAIALDIPLPLLATDFRPMSAWRKP